MIKRRANVSAEIRQAGFFTKGMESVYKAAAAELRNMLLEEFTVLVYETPQYTGTTAASWHIGFLRDVDTSVHEMNPEEPRRKGHSDACEVAVNRANVTLPTDFRQYFGGTKETGLGQDIVIENEAPGYDTAEEGPVRQVNTPPGALKRFIARVATRDIG